MSGAISPLIYADTDYISQISTILKLLLPEPLLFIIKCYAHICVDFTLGRTPLSNPFLYWTSDLVNGFYYPQVNSLSILPNKVIEFYSVKGKKWQTSKPNCDSRYEMMYFKYSHWPNNRELSPILKPCLRDKQLQNHIQAEYKKETRYKHWFISHPNKDNVVTVYCFHVNLLDHLQKIRNYIQTYVYLKKVN
jgi:hypothetical protein